jgi:hypothetical protein
MLHQKFLQKVISEILEKSSDLSGFSFIIPGKRPVVFIKEILKEKSTKYCVVVPVINEGERIQTQLQKNERYFKRH